MPRRGIREPRMAEKAEGGPRERGWDSGHGHYRHFFSFPFHSASSPLHLSRACVSSSDPFVLLGRPSVFVPFLLAVSHLLFSLMSTRSFSPASQPISIPSRTLATSSFCNLALYLYLYLTVAAIATRVSPRRGRGDIPLFLSSLLFI